MRVIVLTTVVVPLIATVTAVSFQERPPVTAIEARGPSSPDQARAAGEPEPSRRAGSPTDGPDVLWDNGLSYLNGLSTSTVPRRSILDDFVVDGAGWSIVGWHAKFGRECGIIGCDPVPWEYTFYADDNGAPDRLNVIAVANNAFTTSMVDPENPDFFGITVHDVWSDWDPIELPPGTYWIEAWNRSSDVSAFQVIGDYPQQRGASVWVDYEDFGGFQSGFDVFGDHYDVNFELVGTPLSTGEVLPSGFDVVFGDYESGDVASLHDSDDEYMIIGQRAPVSVLLPRIRLEVDGVASGETATSIRVTVEASVNSLPTRPPQRLSLLNYDTDAWEQIDERTATLSDSVIEVTIDTDAARFIEPGARTLRLRADWFNPALVFSPAWTARVDQVAWTVVP